LKPVETVLKHIIGSFSQGEEFIMRVHIKKIASLYVMAMAVTLFASAIDAQVRPYSVTDRQVETLLSRIENRADTFKNRLDRALDRTNIDGTRQEDSINYMVQQFEMATNRLQSNFNARRSTAADVQEVLSRAVLIDRFMRNNNLQRNAQQPWNQLRDDLKTLAQYYSVSSDWNSTYPSPVSGLPYNVADRDVQTIIQRLENSTDRFKNQMGRALNNSNIDNTRQEDSINYLVSQFETATNRLRDNFNGRRSTSADAQEVFNRGALIDRFMRNNQLPNRAETTWSQIRGDLNTLAGYYSVAANWEYVGTPSGQVYTGGYAATDAQMRSLLNRIRTNTSDFRTRYTRWSTSPFRRNRTGSQDLSQNLVDLDRLLSDLNTNYRRVGNSEVELVLRSASYIDNQLASDRPSSDLLNRWTLVRTDLSTLASYYRMSWDWNNPVNTGDRWTGSTGSFDSRLTGSYRLNAALSDSVTTIVDRAIVNARYDNSRPNLRNALERRLRSPEQITLEKRGSQVTMSTGNQAPVNFSANGAAQTETSPNGRTVTTRVVSTDRDLTINYEGDRMNDYYVSFSPIGSNQLRVTRRVYIENQNETVTVNSVYDKVSPTPEWSTVPGPGWVGGNSGGFIIPNNTTIVASLTTPLSTRTARDGDRFSMTVDAPGQYNGAVIEGRVVGERSGVVTGRANMSLSFETIRLRNGQSYQFAGIVTQVRQTDGGMVSVNNEGSIRDSNQTTKTVTRAGIGAVLGAVIGAIAGGGQGAAIGAGVGAGAGAGTVILQGRDNLELGSGTQFTITATAPANVGVN
jgi:hypothetical protein